MCCSVTMATTGRRSIPSPHDGNRLAEQAIHRRGRLALGLVEHMGVDVLGQANIRMTQDFHRDTRRDALRRQKASVRVPQIVKTNIGQLGRLSNCLNERIRFRG